MIAVAATGSVGETIAPSAKASGHERPITSCATTATAPIVRSTRPTAAREIPRRSARSDLRSAKNAAAYKSGGRKTTSTRSGSSSISGMPGSRPSTSPPSTSGIGYGTESQRAIALSPATETNSARMTISKSCTGGIVPRRRCAGAVRLDLPGPHPTDSMARAREAKTSSRTTLPSRSLKTCAPCWWISTPLPLPRP